MAKKSAVERNLKRRRMEKKYAGKRERLRATVRDKSLSPEERFAAVLQLAELPRNSAKNRIRNRCALSGRPRGHFRKFNLSRVAIRDLARSGELPGVVKASW